MRINLRVFLFIVFAILLTQNVLAKKISTNLKASYLDAATVAKNLKDAGFSVIGGHSVMGNSKYQILVITNSELKKYARLKKRGFVGVLRVLINNKKKEIMVTNPAYFMRAFLQKKYKKGSEKNIIASLKTALGELKNGKDKLSSGDLGDYHFMLSMPYY